jgi:hypothetical protein
MASGNLAVVNPEAEHVMDEVRAMDWSSWEIQIPGRISAYDPESVVPAFEAIVAVADQAASKRAYDVMLDAIAHNHSGTPYPAMIPATAFLVRMGPSVEPWALTTIVDVLTDCMLWSQDEPEFTGPDHRTYLMGVEIARSCLDLRPLIEPLSDSEGRLGGAARAFLETVDSVASA